MVFWSFKQLFSAFGVGGAHLWGFFLVCDHLFFIAFLLLGGVFLPICGGVSTAKEVFAKWLF